MRLLDSITNSIHNKTYLQLLTVQSMGGALIRGGDTKTCRKRRQLLVKSELQPSFIDRSLSGDGMTKLAVVNSFGESTVWVDSPGRRSARISLRPLTDATD